VPRPFPVRGVIEGFYGAPWSHSARLDAVAFLAERGMNAYVYAPKDDPRHRTRWREPYDEHEAARFRELATACDSRATRFGFALSPGLDVDYHDPDDRAALLGKLVPLLDAGVGWFVLAVDDIPMRPGLGGDQAALATWLHDALLARDEGVRLTLVPTEYVGTRPSDYLAELAEGLPEAVDLMWTGPTVCSPRITATDARAWQDAVGGHRLLLWDNYPVNDGIMAREMHLGAYRGRDPQLADVLDGVLCNPMVQPRSSLVALATAAAFLCDPDGYDERDAWERAIADVGRPSVPRLRALALACADGPLRDPATLQLHEDVGALERAAADDVATALTTVEGALTALRQAADERGLASDDPLVEELRPWCEQARREAEAGLAAVALLRQLREPGGPDAERAMLHVFGVLFTWEAARAGDRVVCGPRFAVHPAVVQLPDGRPAVDLGLAVREDANAVDRLCRHALAAYAAWCAAAGAG
jgi:hyaluronoglucosaminidase